MPAFAQENQLGKWTSSKAIEKMHSEIYYLLYCHTEKTVKREVNFLVKTLRLKPKAKILDLGCGFGRHVIELAKRGFKAVGVDISKKLLSIAKKKAKAKKVKAKFYRKDISKPLFKKKFDAVIMMLNTFGLLSDKDNEKVLKNASRALKKGGKIFIDLRDPEKLKKGTFYGRIKYVDRQKIRVARIDHKVYTKITYYPKRKRVLGKRYFYHHGKKREYIFEVRLYTPSELKKLFSKYKLKVLHFFGDFTGEKYNKKRSQRLIVVGEKQ